MTEVITTLRGHHEPQEELVFDAILRHVPEQAVMIEVGGFWAYYSLWFTRGHPLRSALLIEPDPNHLAVGRRNAALNPGKLEFLPGFVGAADRAEVPFQTESAGIHKLPMINVATLIEQRGFDPLDILHCDAQGGEIDVLKSCETHLRDGRIHFLVLSTHAEAISGDALIHQRCLDAVLTLGGQILAEHDVHESFSGDGLIAAYFGREPIEWRPLALSYNRYSTSLFRNPVYDLSLARVELDRLKQRPPQK
jgi:FkbM family methyltransferase